MVEAFRRKRNISPNRAEFRVRGYRERSATALEIWPTSQSAFHTPQRRFRRIYHSSVHLDASEKLSDTLVEHDLNCTLQISAQHGLLRDDKLTLDAIQGLIVSLSQQGDSRPDLPTPTLHTP
jgi:hypothetical protein